jgi:hypothetical protein
MIIIEVKEKVLAVVWTNLITKTPPTNSFISTPQVNRMVVNVKSQQGY